MGVGRSIVSEINVDYLKMNYPTPLTFVQPSTGGDTQWYVIYRLSMAMYMFATIMACLTYVGTDQYEPHVIMHFPIWGYAICGLQSILMAFCTVRHYYSVYKTMSETSAKHKEKRRRSSGASIRRKSRMAFSVSQPKMPKIYIVIWVFYYIMLYSSMMSFLEYHAGLFKGRMVYVTLDSLTKTPNQVLVHQVFIFYCLLDFFVCGIPVRLLHAYVMTIFATVYHVALLSYTFAMSQKKNYRPLYDVADVQMNRITISSLYYVGFSFITPVAAHIVYYYLFLLRSYLVELYSRKTRAITQTSQPDTDATVVPEDKGDAGATEWAPGALRSNKIQPISEQEETEISSINREQSPSNNSIALVDLK